jgi:hypothetical protein
MPRRAHGVSNVPAMATRSRNSSLICCPQATESMKNVYHRTFVQMENLRSSHGRRLRGAAVLEQECWRAGEGVYIDGRQVAGHGLDSPSPPSATVR